MGCPRFRVFGCLLYTSDAADERSSVDLGGRRIIKKKKKVKPGGVEYLQKKEKQATSERDHKHNWDNSHKTTNESDTKTENKKKSNKENI